MKILVNDTWEEKRLAPGDESAIWELFHENSKTSPYDSFIAHEELRVKMGEILISQEFLEFPETRLPEVHPPLTGSLQECILARETAREMVPQKIDFDTLAALLQYAYGETRSNADNNFPHPFRTVPSGGALYPLEIFFHTTMVEGLQPGMYHFSPSRNSIQLLSMGDETRSISENLVQPELAYGASVMFFITALFDRSIFKYGDRGYRFICLEAGHCAQNINLVAQSFDLGSTNIGGYYDRKMDKLLGFDGVTQSTIYVIAVGGKSDGSQTVDQFNVQTL